MPFDKIGRALASRPTFERDITRTISPEGIATAPGAAQIRAPNIGPSGEVVPGTNQQNLQLGTGGFIQPPPSEQQTETLQVQGAPRGLTLLADFLTGFGAGPQAALQQQAQRRQGVERRFGVAQQQADRESALGQQNFQRDMQFQRLQQEVRKQDFNEAKFFAGLNQAGVDLSSPTELSTISVLLRNGVDLSNRQSVLQGLGNKRILGEIGQATRQFGKQAQGSLAERIATLRGFDAEKDPKGFADAVVKAKRELSPGRSLGRGVSPPTKSVRDKQAEFVLQDVFGLNPPSRARQGLRTLPGVQRFNRLKLDLSELIRFAGDEDTVRELLQAAREALGPSATAEQLVDAVEREIELETKKKRFGRRRR